MKKTLLTLAALLTLTTLIACTQPSEQPAPEPAATPTPAIIAEWKGIGNKTTEPFEIESEVWAIVWLFVPDEPFMGMYSNLLSIEVSSPTDSSYFKLPVNLANVKQHVDDISYFYQAGTFTLDIMSLSGRWKVQVIGMKY
ncbi:hypothetical protein ACFLW1_02675 [Chloroflexota bacterium]